MTNKVFHIVGNGDNAILFKRAPREGKVLICNMPPFEIENVFASCMVDFKMMHALTEGSLRLDQYDWILGTRPQIWMQEQPGFYLKYAKNVREMYPHVPEYAGGATNFNCGMMAVHYAAARQGATEIHLYGFDSLFDFNMRSVTDLYLMADRDNNNNYRLIENWRPVWKNLFEEFPNTEFHLHHTHDGFKIPTSGNVTIEVYEKRQPKAPKEPRKKIKLAMSRLNNFQDGVSNDVIDGILDEPSTPPVETPEVQLPQVPLNRNQRRHLEKLERAKKK